MSRKFCLVGLPDDLGVQNVGGRVGAAHGPTAFREFFFSMKGQKFSSQDVEDRGNSLASGEAVEARHTEAQRFIQDGLREAKRSVIVGGGHDLAFPHLNAVRAIIGDSAKVGCINIDAHLDVRRPAPLITSGSPFFLAIESGVLDGGNLVEFGVQSQANTPELWEYASQKKIQIVTFSELRNSAKPVHVIFEKHLKALAKSVDTIVLSMDLDAIQESFAPGVSSPQAEGFSPDQVCAMMEIAGSHPKVKSLGIFELNPLHDLNGKTARLAAILAYRFLESTPHSL